MKAATLIVWFGVLFVNTYGQREDRVLDWKSEHTVNAFLLQRMHAQYDQRRARFAAALQTPPSMRAYRDSCRQRYRDLIGPLPKRTSLKPFTTGTIRQNGYRIEKIVYESVPGHHVTSNLYVPDGTGPFPAVVLLCGHEDEAKATGSYQRTAILFALNGFVVLVIDPVSQAERHQLIDSSGKPLTRGGTTEHTLINAAATLTGSGTVAYQLWDNVRGIDLLESRKEVDKSRIGCLGNSGGGTQTTYLAAMDDRIQVAATCSYLASRERNFDLTGPNDGCQHVPGEGKALLEISDFLIMFAPKPQMILAGRYDFVDYTGTQIAFDELQQVYARFGAAEKVSMVTVDDGHGISKPKREAVVNWFRRWLYNDTTRVREPELSTRAPDELMCTGSHQVGKAFAGEQNTFMRSSAMAALYRKNRSAGRTLRQRVAEMVNAPENWNDVSAEVTGAVERNGTTFHRIILRGGGGVPLPVLAAYPEQVKGVVLWFDEKGKRHLADSASLIQQYLNEGKAILMADVSGVGELADSKAHNDPKYYNSEYRIAMLAIHTGTSLPALRALDMMRVVEFASVNERTKSAPVEIYASGICVVPALHAAVLDERIKRLSMHGGIASFYEVFDHPAAKDWYSYVVPGVLRSYDVPELLDHVRDRVGK